VTKKCTIYIEYCNNLCPYFYHKYSDSENMYCDILKVKIADCEQNDDVMCDLKPRPIPDICPLQDASLYFACGNCGYKITLSREEYEKYKSIKCQNCGNIGEII
jgi:DNA-directed RNA polymerase subunit RPC12/RpoP